jgi:hypothetical protein
MLASLNLQLSEIYTNCDFRDASMASLHKMTQLA